MRLTTLEPRFVDQTPEVLELGVLYVSEKYKTAIHLCACGSCGWKTVTPFNQLHGWTYKRTIDDKVTLHPSIGNQQFPCKSHYWVQDNQVKWC
jgi:hypothetical protein